MSLTMFGLAGVLQHSELAALLDSCGFHLSADQVLAVVQQADVNHDGVVRKSCFSLYT